MHGLTALAAERPGPCPLQLPVTGRIHGQPWRRHLEFAEAAVLMRHLGTAAMIICLYLTGMRPQEVQGLRSGCCPDPEPNADGTPGRHLIRSHHYKNVTNTDGHHVSAGEERKVPWVAITPVVHAVRVLERMVPPGELLLSAAHHDFALQRGHHGALKRHALNRRIDAFIVWANSEALA
jgi:integrase